MNAVSVVVDNIEIDVRTACLHLVVNSDTATGQQYGMELYLMNLILSSNQMTSIFV